MLYHLLLYYPSALTRVVSMRETDVSKYRNRYRRRAHRHQAFRPAVSAPQLGGVSEEVHKQNTYHGPPAYIILWSTSSDVYYIDLAIIVPGIFETQNNTSSTSILYTGSIRLRR